MRSNQLFLTKKSPTATTSAEICYIIAKDKAFPSNLD